VAEGGRVSLSQGADEVRLTVQLDSGMPEGSIAVPAGLRESIGLGARQGTIRVNKG
jgi:hypothetical protein